MKKQTIIGLSIILLTFGSCILGIWNRFDEIDLCGNDIYSISTSPEKNYRVIIFERNCGATTGFSTQISLLMHNQELTNSGGNIFAMDGHPDWTNVKVNWIKEDYIVIEYNKRYKVYYKENIINKINIFYKVIEDK